MLSTTTGVFGQDYGLGEVQGFNRSALFRLHLNGPTKMPFNFGDSVDVLSSSGTGEAGSFMGWSHNPTTADPLASLFAFEARRMARAIASAFVLVVSVYLVCVRVCVCVCVCAYVCVRAGGRACVRALLFECGELAGVCEVDCLFRLGTTQWPFCHHSNGWMAVV